MPLFLGDEELGKKDDDHKYSKTKMNTIAASWQHRRAPMRRNLKRVFLGIGALSLVYLFIKNMPTDVKHPNLRPHYQPSGQSSNGGIPMMTSSGGGGNSQKNAPPGRPANSMKEEEYYFDGPIKFYELASSLHAASAATNGNNPVNKNVLFAAASLKSAANLIPLACEMAASARNDVHFALLGRDDVAMDMLKAINSVDKECHITFHDARPDFSPFSTSRRMETSSSAGLGHINNFLHPQAVIVDKSGLEEIWLLKSFRDRAAQLGKTLIELPKDAAQNMMWFTRLDFASLNAWNRVNIDIIIHAQPAASGSLMRLLTSLWKADYFSSPPPRLTIELPNSVDTQTDQFLRTFQWPPSHHHGDSNANQLTLHRRIPQHGLTAEENSLRLVESFWPTDPYSSHVLILSPNVELSPLYYHYLKYTLLEYHYSFAALGSKIMGISLDLPTTYLNDTTHFISPTKDAPFLWDSPNSNAALYIGQRWTELHSFISHSTHSSHNLPTPTTLNQKHVSKTYPAWLEHVLNLARARGYPMLYPQTSETGEALATIHHDLYQAPEEYNYAMNPDHTIIDKESPLPDITEEMIASPSAYLSLSDAEAKIVKGNLLDSFFADKTLPRLGEIKTLSWDGRQVSQAESGLESKEFVATFRREIGGCKLGESPPIAKEGDSADLFCFARQDEDISAESGSIKERNSKFSKELVGLPSEQSQSTILSVDGQDRPESASSSSRPETVPVGSEEVSNVEVTKNGDAEIRNKPTSKILVDKSPPPPQDHAAGVEEWKERHLHGATRIPGTGIGQEKEN